MISMRKFLFRCGLFLAIVVATYTICFAGIKFLLRRKIAQSEIIVFGDSQTRNLNFPNSFNLSIGGSPYFVHYVFADEFKSAIRNKKILIACNAHSLSNLYQNRLQNDSLLPGWASQSIERMNRYAFLNRQLAGINPETPWFDMKGLVDKPIQMVKDAFVPNKPNTGSFIRDTMQIAEIVERHFFDPRLTAPDKIQRRYLEKLIATLQANKNDVYLLKMPVTHFYDRRAPTEIKETISQVANSTRVELIDLQTALQIQQRYDLFLDYGHLNIRGDSMVQQHLNRVLN